MECLLISLLAFVAVRYSKELDVAAQCRSEVELFCGCVARCSVVASLSCKSPCHSCYQGDTPRLVLAACQPADAKTPDANVKLSVLLRDAQLDHLDNIKAGLSRIKAESLNELQSVRRSEQTCVLQRQLQRYC